MTLEEIEAEGYRLFSNELITDLRKVKSLLILKKHYNATSSIALAWSFDGENYTIPWNYMHAKTWLPAGKRNKPRRLAPTGESISKFA